MNYFYLSKGMNENSPFTISSNATLDQNPVVVDGNTLFVCSFCEFRCFHKLSLIQHTVSHINDEDVQHEARQDYHLEKEQESRNEKLTTDLIKVLLGPKAFHEMKQRNIYSSGMKYRNMTAPYAQDESIDGMTIESVRDRLLEFLEMSKRSINHAAFVSNGPEISCLHPAEKLEIDYKHNDSEDLDSATIYEEPVEAKVEPPTYLSQEKSLDEYVYQNLPTFSETVSSKKKLSDDNVISDQKWQCKICNYTCESSSYLRRHMLFHTDHKAFSCPECPFHCDNEELLAIHKMRKHGGDMPYQCDKCGMKYKTRQILTRHIQDSHYDVKPLSCTLCGYSCVRLERLQDHLHRHMDIRPFICKICSFACRSRLNLASHMKSHNMGKLFACVYCGKLFKAMENVKKHLLAKHGKYPFSCEYCPFNSKIMLGMKKHVVFHEKDQFYLCEMCGYTCLKIVELKEHLIQHVHTEIISCDVCSFVCQTYEQLKVHKTLGLHVTDKGVEYTGSQSISKNVSSKTKQVPSFFTGYALIRNKADPSLLSKQCDNIGQSSGREPQRNGCFVFVKSREQAGCSLQQKSVENSANISQGIETLDYDTSTSQVMKKPYDKRRKEHVCLVCQQIFGRKAHLKRHMTSHKEVRPYLCPECDSTWKTEEALKAHMKKKHSGIKNTFFCKICNRGFFQKCRLAAHLLIHTDFKAHKCHLCPFASSSKSGLSMHMMMHTDTRPFLCSVCGNGFRSGPKLKEHMIKHTEGKNQQCPYCEYRCRWPNQLSKHVKTKHTSNKTDEKKQEYLCPICGYICEYQSSLRNHMMIHSDSRPHSCPHCSFCSRTTSQLKSHIASCHNELLSVRPQTLLTHLKHESESNVVVQVLDSGLS